MENNDFTVRFLEPYATELVAIEGRIEGITIQEVASKFVTHNVSYLPLVSNEGYKLNAILSRKKYFELLIKKNKDDISPKELETRNNLEIIGIDEPLDDALDKLDQSSGLILSKEGRLRKFISPKGVVKAFKSYAHRYILLERVEKAVRNEIALFIPDFIEVLKVHGVEYKAGKEEYKALEDLYFNDYRYIFSKEWDRFSNLKSFSKVLFIRQLSEIMSMRNALFHFRDDDKFEVDLVNRFLKHF